jgi:hypothetical protein
MDNMIGYCGYNCGICAARSDDPSLKRKLVDGWRKIFGYEMYTVENVGCDGCLNNGKIADKNCKVRPCAIKKGVKNCIFCDDFPCDKIKNLITSKDRMLVCCYPHTSSITEEEYNLCLRQFDNTSRLVKMLIKEKKIPIWLKKY